MLAALGYGSMAEFESAAVPHPIRVSANTVSDESIPPLSESQLLARATELAGKNDVFKSYIGMGYHTAVVPPVVLRNVRIGSGMRSVVLKFSDSFVVAM